MIPDMPPSQESPRSDMYRACLPPSLEVSIANFIDEGYDAAPLADAGAELTDPALETLPTVTQKRPVEALIFSEALLHPNLLDRRPARNLSQETTIERRPSETAHTG